MYFINEVKRVGMVCNKVLHKFLFILLFYLRLFYIF